uniref:Uncharacterized protein n=1 Tax=Strigamia maritima TaxID=126957 RepID=T1IXV7_STRMM
MLCKDYLKTNLADHLYDTIDADFKKFNNWQMRRFSNRNNKKSLINNDKLYFSAAATDDDKGMLILLKITVAAKCSVGHLKFGLFHEV